MATVDNDFPEGQHKDRVAWLHADVETRRLRPRAWNQRVLRRGQQRMGNVNSLFRRRREPTDSPRRRRQVSRALGDPVRAGHGRRHCGPMARRASSASDGEQTASVAPSRAVSYEAMTPAVPAGGPAPDGRGPAATCVTIRPR